MENPVFLYDDACPLCRGYTGAFTRLKWSGRRGFSTLQAGEWPELDRQRGRHEIPLIDLRTGKVRYGLAAMTEIIGNGMPLVAPLIRNRYFIAIMKPLYWLITYNRRIIAGTKPPALGFDCAPDLHVGWRLFYLAMALSVICYLGLPSLPLVIGLGLSCVVGLLLQENSLDFLGNFLTVVLGTAGLLALLPGWLGVVAAYLFAGYEGWRRFS